MMLVFFSHICIHGNLAIETVKCSFKYHRSQFKKKYLKNGPICVHSESGTEDGNLNSKHFALSLELFVARSIYLDNQDYTS